MNTPRVSDDSSGYELYATPCSVAVPYSVCLKLGVPYGSISALSQSNLERLQGTDWVNAVRKDLSVACGYFGQSSLNYRIAGDYFSIRLLKKG